MLTTGTHLKARIIVMAVLIGVAAMLPVQWRVSAQRAWSYGVYYVGYRLLSVQLSCGSLAVSGVPFPFGMKYVP
jgi:Ni/Fe-hydrogenase subunit HybB-like protein